jgi:hypothetical protein
LSFEEKKLRLGRDQGDFGGYFAGGEDKQKWFDRMET